MGGVAILHPQTCLKDHHPENLLSTAMKTIKFTNPPSGTPNFNVPGSRRGTPPKGILKKKNDRNSTELTASKNIVMGQVKILKRGEALNDSSAILNDRKLSNGAASMPEKRLVADREASEMLIGGRGVLHRKKKVEKGNMFSNSSPKIEASIAEEVADLSSTRRLGPEPEIVSKQMMCASDCFAGSAFSDSPPPSSVPLPGFFRKKFAAAVKEDATTDLRRILGLVPPTHIVIPNRQVAVQLC